MGESKPKTLQCPVCGDEFYDCYLYWKHVSDHPAPNTIEEIEKAFSDKALMAKMSIKDQEDFAQVTDISIDYVRDILAQAKKGELPKT